MLASPDLVQAQQDFQHLLRGVFYAEPNTGISCRGLNNEDSKSVRRLQRPIVAGDIQRHVESDCRAGRGALGITPGFLVTENGRRRWVTRFLVLDFDSTEAEQLLNFVGQLLEQKLQPFVTTGTSGRGSHVYVLYRQPQPVHEVFRLAEWLQRQAVRHKLPPPEIRPSRAFGRGEAILLPYRGAARDGFGFNPFLDPETLQAICLSAVARRF